MPENEQTRQNDGAAEKQILPKKIYTKDSSFESPNSPAIFTEEWKPELELELSSATNQIGNDTYEVIQTLTAKMKTGEVVAYLAEVQQAGIFTLTGLDNQELEAALNVHCMRTLHPYACAAICDLVSKGGFPQLVLLPIRFMQLYKQRKEQQASQQS